MSSANDYIDLTVSSDDDSKRPSKKPKKAKDDKAKDDEFDVIKWAEEKDEKGYKIPFENGPNGLKIRRTLNGARIIMPDGESWIDFHQIDQKTADEYLYEFDNDTHYAAVGRPLVFGKNKTPRDQAFYYQGSKPDQIYRFSGRKFKGNNVLPPGLSKFWTEMEDSYGDLHFAVMNRYMNNMDSISAHADDEEEIYSGSAIPSLSLGATRMFVVEPNEQYKGRITLPNKGKLNIHLRHGDVIVMGGNFQKVYKHSIPKNLNAGAPSGKRINVTIRKFKDELKKKFSK
jgi:alkylated DNA repair dioxygenase AlkB